MKDNENTQDMAEVDSNALLAEIVIGLMRDRSTLICQRRDLDGNKLWRGRSNQWKTLTQEISDIDRRISDLARLEADTNDG